MTVPTSRRYLALWLPMMAEDIWRLGKPPEDLPVVFVEKLDNAMRLTALSRTAIA